MKKRWEKTWRGLGVIQSSPRVFLEHPENIQLIHTNSMPKFKPAFCRKRWIQRQKRRHWVLSSLIKIHLRSGCSLGLFNYVIQYISIYLASLFPVTCTWTTPDKCEEGKEGEENATKAKGTNLPWFARSYNSSSWYCFFRISFTFELFKWIGAPNLEKS